MKLTKNYLKKIIIETMENVPHNERFRFDLEEVEYSISQVQSALTQISQNINELKEIRDFNSKEAVSLLKKIDKVAKGMQGSYDRRNKGPIQNEFANIRDWLKSIRVILKRDPELEANKSSMVPDEPF